MKSTVALLGASGFIGRAIHAELETCGFSVVPFYSDRAASFENKSISSVYVDFHNTSRYRELIGLLRPDIIISTPWVTSLPDYRTSPLNLQFKNSTISLAKIALEFETSHFICFGSSAEYGDNNLACDSSTSPINPLDLYSQSKYETYLELSNLFRYSTTRFNWLRVFQPFGEYQDSNRLIPYLVSELSAGRTPVLREPNRVSDWVSSKDIADATIFSIKNNLPEILDIGSTIGTHNWELVSILMKILEIDSPRIETSISYSESRGLVASKLSPIFQAGWQPSGKLHESLSVLFGFSDR